MVLIKLYIFRATFTRTPLGDFLSIKMFIGNILYIYIIYDIIYEIIHKKAYNSSFHQNLEKIQYISPLAITGVIRGTSKEYLCQGLEYLEKKGCIENSVILIRSLKSNLQHTSSMVFLCLVDHTLQETSKMFILLK